MKLITWNCQGAFRKKAEVILKTQPDILVVQECENPDKIIFGSGIQKPNDFCWHGDSVHKGLAIYTYSDYTFELLPDYNSKFQYVLPFRVTGHGHTFTLFAVWAMDNKENPEDRYIRQVWLAINHYTTLFNSPSILIGDFNSNKIWDNDHKVGNHSEVVSKLAESNIHSIYHKHFAEEQGYEKQPTFFLQRNRSKPYHIDYCFVSTDLADKVQSVEVGSYENWIMHSDHLPLIVTFDL